MTLNRFFFSLCYIDKNVLERIAINKIMFDTDAFFFLYFLDYSYQKKKKLTTFEKDLNYENSWCPSFFTKKRLIIVMISENFIWIRDEWKCLRI
jgi:hypothetical protein